MLIVAEKYTSLILKRKIQVVAKPEKFTCIEGMVRMTGIKYRLTFLWMLTAFPRMYEKDYEWNDWQNKNGGEPGTPTRKCPLCKRGNACFSVQPEFLWNPLCDSPEQRELGYRVDGNMLQLQSCCLGDCPSSWEFLFYKRNNIS